MRKFFLGIHLWLSVPVGVIITVVCLTGAALVFETEINEWLNPSLYRVQRQENAARLRPSEIIAAVGRQMPDSLEVSGVKFSGDTERTCLVSFKNLRKQTLCVDPYTGEVKGWSRKYAFFSTVKKLHRWLMDAPAKKGGKTAGKSVVGVSTLLMVVILVSGLVVWIPKKRKSLKRRLSVAVGKGGRRFWHDTHVALGFYSALLLLAMALTGLTWSFGWYRSVFYAVFGVPQSRMTTVSRQEKQPENSREEVVDYAVWDKALVGVESRFPGCQSMEVLPGSVRVVPAGAVMREEDIVAFNGKTGEITGISAYADRPDSAKMKSWIYAAHTGLWGGVWTKILYFLAALIGASLPVTGYCFWLRKKRRKRTSAA